MRLTKDVLKIMFHLQQKYPKFILSGSAALIMCDALDDRPISDIDIVLKKSDLPYSTIFSGLKIDNTNYPTGGDGYNSYHASYKGLDMNLLVYDNDRLINHKDHYVPGVGIIKHQELQDIIYWKQKYKRPKDLKDIENITTKAMEKAIFEEAGL